VLRDHIVNPVSRPVVDAHFEDALADALGVAGISHLHAANAADDAHGRIDILRRLSQPENSSV
jgi:hypothetical protein